jgi:hypothetical protein
MSHNPYMPPSAAVEDARTPLGDDELIPGGRRRPLLHGWSWIGAGWALFRHQPGMWILSVVLFYGALVAVGFASIAIPFANFIVSPLGVVLWAGFMAAAHRAHRGEYFNLGELFAGFRKRLGSLLLLGLVYIAGIVAISVGLSLAAGWGMSLGFAGGHVTPEAPNFWPVWGAYMAATLLWATTVMFAPALMYLNDVPMFSAMKMSITGCLKNILPVLLFFVVYLVLLLVSALPLFLGLLVTLPVGVAAFYGAYRDIFLRPVDV